MLTIYGLHPRFPKPCPRVIAYPAWAARVAREKARVAREKARDNARAVAVIWDMHVFINQLIECEISF